MLHEIQSLADAQDVVVRGPVQAECILERKGEDKVSLRGRLVAEVLLPCDRCLRMSPFPVDSTFQLLFAVDAGEAWRVKEMDSAPVDLETEILTEPAIDLDDVMRQQLYLALPIKHLCSADCCGLCLRCGANLNEEACRCDQVNENSPFAVLKKLKR